MSGGPLGGLVSCVLHKRPAKEDGVGGGCHSQPGSVGPLTSVVRSVPFLTADGCRRERQYGGPWEP